MDSELLKEQIEIIRQFFLKNKTKDISYRISSLKRLYNNILLHEEDIMEALDEDLSKSFFESYSTEIGLVLSEIKYHIKHLKRWSKPKHKAMPLLFYPSKSAIVAEPYGVVLIIAPWNYPFQLLFSPLVAAISAGNAVVLKTSPNAPATAKIMDTIIKKTFPAEYVSIFHGNRQVNQSLLAERFDYIFFTGSPSLGKIVMESASHYLTPVTLELGGKSPCIIDQDANLAVAAKRVVWGKTLNCGQTCIAPDYLFVHQSIKELFCEEIRKSIIEMYGDNPQESPDYPRIISLVAMKRLTSYLQTGKIIMGGKYDYDDYYIEPTIIESLPDEAPILHEEIFGPIFPLLTFTEIDEVIQYVKQREKPLALYYFTQDKGKAKKMIAQTSSGGICINDTIIHVGNNKIPFGGVGNSGMGQYHGKFGFDTFTHYKATVKSTTALDIKIKYPPYRDKLQKFKYFLKNI